MPDTTHGAPANTSRGSGNADKDKGPQDVQGAPGVQSAGVDPGQMGFTFTPADRFVEQRLLVPLRFTQDVTLVTPSKAAQIVGLLDQTLQQPDMNLEQVEDILHRYDLDPLVEVMQRVVSEPEPNETPLPTARVREERESPQPQDNPSGRTDSAPGGTPRNGRATNGTRDDGGGGPAPWFARTGMIPDESHDRETVELANNAVVLPEATVAALNVDTPMKADVSVARLLNNDVGILFLDRTRVRPVGFCPGDHITTISLGPGEELTVEQKSFSKREATYEEVNDTERQFDLELSSTLANSIEEGMSRAEQHTASSGWNVGGSISGEYKGVKVGINGGYSSSVSDADQKSRTRSSTDSFTASRKVASKYRTQHKTTFRIVTEQRFEATSKRVLRNPNRYTPVDLHYFKVLQRMQMTQERYGVRLCWAPFVPDPAFGVVQRIEAQRQVLRDKYKPVLAAKPLPPNPPAARPPQVVSSPVVTVKDFSFTGGLSADFDLEVSPPAHYAWDRDAQFVIDSLVGTAIGSVNNRGPSWYVVGQPFANGEGKVQVKVHVGVGEGSPFGNKGRIELQVWAQFVATPDQADATYQAAYAAWEAAVATWEANNAKAITEADAKAKAEGDAYEAEVWQNLNATNELLNRIVAALWPLQLRDEASEVDLWRQLFEWESAAFDLYPSWWSDRPMRNPLAEPTDFRNASWARVYLPLRTGREAEALEFILTGGDPRKLDSAVSQIVATTLNDLKAYRAQQFGTETGGPVSTPGQPQGTPNNLNEKVLTLGRWEELLPTDGTHCEITVALTTGADVLSRAELDDANQLRDAWVKQVEGASTALANAKVNNATFHLDLTEHDGIHEPF